MHIDLTIVGRVASIDASHADSIRPLLQLCVRRFAPGGPQGFQQRKETITYHAEHNGRLYFPAGLVSRVRQHLESIGYAVEIVDHTYWEHLHSADRSVLDDRNGNAATRDAAGALSKNPRGQLLVVDLEEVACTIATMCRLFKRNNILVVARNRAAADWLARNIARQSDRPVDREFSVAKHRRPRVLVVTSQAASTVGGDDFGILIYADVESALHESNDPLPRPPGQDDTPDYRVSLLGRWPNSATHLVHDAHRELTASEEFRVEAIFGPIIFSVFDPDARRDIVVAFVSLEATRISNRKCSGLDHKRCLYWHNTAWNSRIAAVAQQVATGALPVEPPDGITIAPNPDICVLVETPEHGVELQRRLPGWPLLTSRSPAAPERILMRHRIVTFSHAADRGLDADIVIRADGGADWPLHGVLERARALVSSRLVIDFTDDRNQRCRADTDSRLAAYKRADWTVASRMSRKLLRYPNEPEPVAEN